MKKIALILLAVLISTCSSSNDTSEPTTEKTFSKLIIGKWKLTKQEKTIDGVLLTDDYTNDNDETTHEYFEDGTMIFHEWGETFNIRFTITGSYLNHIDDEVFSYKIISMDNSEMVLELPDDNDSPRTRYYNKLN